MLHENELQKIAHQEDQTYEGVVEEPEKNAAVVEERRDENGEKTKKKELDAEDRKKLILFNNLISINLLFCY